MQSAAVVLRILGSLLYYSPTEPQIQDLLPELQTLPELFPWKKPDNINALCAQLPVLNEDEFVYQFSVLFEGQGDMPVPPWGSVYLDKFNLLMSDSTLSYRQFLDDKRLIFMSKINEPEDQFGLMLLALSVFVDQDDQDAVKTVLSQHLLPWGFRYLTLLTDNDVSPFYSQIAKITTEFLAEIAEYYHADVVTAQLYF